MIKGTKTFHLPHTQKSENYDTINRNLGKMLS